MIDRILAFLMLCLVLGLPFGAAMLFTGTVILNFVFFWPLFMSALWITGGIYFWFHQERHWRWWKDIPALVMTRNPLLSILIPCFHEGINARATIQPAHA